jgi:ribonuclease-3
MVDAPKTFNPWNLKNKDITTQDVESIMHRYGSPGFKVRELKWFAQACIHKSYVDRPEVWAEQSSEQMIVAERPPGCLALKEKDNEELEFAGDSVLSAIVGKYLKMRYPGEGEGFLTSLRTQIVNNNMLGELAKKMGYAPFLVLSRHVEEICDGRNNLRILGSMLEAWIDAIMEHEGNEGPAYDVARKFFISIMERHINFSKLIAEDTNFKDQLLRYFQSQYHQPPRYKEVKVEGPPHDRTFTMGVLDPQGTVIATSTARNKKVAEQEASRLALDILTKKT